MHIVCTSTGDVFEETTVYKLYVPQQVMCIEMQEEVTVYKLYIPQEVVRIKT